MGAVARVSRARRVAFVTWAILVSAVLGIGFFGLTALVLGWFEGEDPALPVTDLGHGALTGIIMTAGVLLQVRAPERRIAGLQQAVLGALAILLSVLLSSDAQNLFPGLVFLGAVAILIALHPARRELIRAGSGFSVLLASIAVLGAIPLVAYALSVSAQARDVAGPPHYAQRLETMAAMAIAIILVALLAAFRTRGWRIPARSAGAAAIVFGLASVVFPTSMGSVGRGWGVLAAVGGASFIVAAEWEARRLPG